MTERSISHWGIIEVDYDWLDDWYFTILAPLYFKVII